MMTFHEDELSMNENSLGYYDALARGGAGVVTVEAPTIDYPLGARWRERYRMDDDRFIPGMTELVDVIHSYGAPAFMQMEHDGPWQSPLFDNAPATFDGPPIGASAMNIRKLGDFHRDMIRPLTVPEIQEITRKYVDGAERAQKAGYDGIDINAGSSHIIHNFLSPFWNRRTDEYGGTQVKRAKLLLDILTGIKERCGADFPIVVCLNGFEDGHAIGADHTFTHDQAVMTMLLAEEAGADAIMIRSSWLGVHVAGFLPDYLFFPDAQVPLDQMPPQYYAKERGRSAMRLMTDEARKILSVPVILVGYVTPDDGEKLLGEGRGRLHRHEPAADVRPEPAQQAGRRSPRGRGAVHALRHLPRPERGVPAALPPRTPRSASATRTCRPSRARARRSSSWAAARPAWRPPASPRCAATTSRSSRRRPSSAAACRWPRSSRAATSRTSPNLIRYLKGQLKKNGVKVHAQHRGDGRVDQGDERRRGDPRDRRPAHLAGPRRARRAARRRCSPRPSSTSRSSPT